MNITASFKEYKKIKCDRCGNVYTRPQMTQHHHLRANCIAIDEIENAAAHKIEESGKIAKKFLCTVSP